MQLWLLVSAFLLRVAVASLEVPISPPGPSKQSALPVHNTSEGAAETLTHMRNGRSLQTCTYAKGASCPCSPDVKYPCFANYNGKGCSCWSFADVASCTSAGGTFCLPAGNSETATSTFTFPIWRWTSRTFTVTLRPNTRIDVTVKQPAGDSGPSTLPSASETKGAARVGGVIGGLVGALVAKLLCIGAWCRYCRKGSAVAPAAGEDVGEDMVIQATPGEKQGGTLPEPAVIIQGSPVGQEGTLRETAATPEGNQAWGLREVQ